MKKRYRPTLESLCRVYAAICMKAKTKCVDLSPCSSPPGGRRRSGAEGHRAGDGSGQRVAGQGRPCTETQQERHSECYHGEVRRWGGGQGRGAEPQGEKGVRPAR